MAIRPMTRAERNHLIQEGFTETRTRASWKYKASVGEKVWFQKDYNLCERIVSAVGCIFIAPLACVSYPCISCCCKEQCSESYDSCGYIICDGQREKIGFFEDKDATRELHRQDYEKLGFELKEGKSYPSQKSLRNYVKMAQEKGGEVLVQSREHPHLSYMTFYGPVSQFSYVLVIPRNERDPIKLFPTSNQQGDPCNAVELKKKAQVLCAGYKPTANKVRVVTEDVPVRRAEVYTPYGTGHVVEYEKRELIKNS